jgi:hypothetical protein
VDLSERGVVEPVGKQRLLAKDVHAGSRGREATSQHQEQVSGGSADGDIGFAVDITDGSGIVSCGIFAVMDGQNNPSRLGAG